MKVKDLIKKLQALKPELQNKEIVMITENGAYQEPHIRLEPKEKSDVFYNLGVKRVILHWE